MPPLKTGWPGSSYCLYSKPQLSDHSFRIITTRLHAHTKCSTTRFIFTFSSLDEPCQNIFNCINYLVSFKLKYTFYTSLISIPPIIARAWMRTILFVDSSILCSTLRPPIIPPSSISLKVTPPSTTDPS